MTKMFKYLKKSIPTLLLIVAILVVQAICDLSLPTYTAQIVDVGIQQQGVENPSPSVIRASAMESLSLLMTQAEYEQTVLPNYTLLPIESGTRYPTQASETLYERKQTNEETRSALDKVFSKAYLIQMILSGDVPEGLATVEMGDFTSPVPKGADVGAVLKALPTIMRESMLAAFTEKLAAVPETMLSQVAVLSVRKEYEAVGLNVSAMQSNYILLAGLRMLAIALLGMAASVTVGFFGARIAATLGRDLRSKVFHRVVTFSQKEMDQFSTASLITRSTNDIQQVQMIMVFLLRMVIYAPILGLGGVLKVINTNLSMAWIIALAVGIILLLVATLYLATMPRFKKLQIYIDQLNRVAREILTGLPVIRAFATQKKEEERFDEANLVLNNTQRFVTRVMSGMMPIMMLVMNGITLLILWVGAHNISNGAMQVGDMMAFVQYAMQIIMAFLMISMMSVMLPRASVSAKRIDEVISTPSSISNPRSPIDFDAAQKGLVRFEDVSFRYPGAEEDILSHLTFTAQPGQTTAILGGTGSGKSTLVQLIPRFFDVTGGRVMVDGQDVREVSQHDLRARIGYVPQKGVLFSGTVASNIAFGMPDAQEEEIRKAAEIAQANTFIEEKPEQYQSAIAQGGYQRIRRTKAALGHCTGNCETPRDLCVR